MLVIGVGNQLRGDDGAGIEVARRLSGPASLAGVGVREHQGEPVELLDVWQGWPAVVLIDTMRSGASPGTIRRFDASSEPLPARWRRPSTTHALAIDDAIELGRALGRLPPRLIIYAVEGRTFEAGSALSGEVEANIGALASAIAREASELGVGDDAHQDGELRL